MTLHDIRLLREMVANDEPDGIREALDRRHYGLDSKAKEYDKLSNLIKKGTLKIKAEELVGLFDCLTATCPHDPHDLKTPSPQDATAWEV
jgi:hypothetical protein